MADSDCLNDRKLCLCDGACGMSCIRPEKECPELPDPPHGQVNSICTFLPIAFLSNQLLSGGHFSSYKKRLEKILHFSL